MPDILFAQPSPRPLWSGTLHFILHTFLHTVIFFLSQHAHSNATCFAVRPRLCHLILVYLSTLLGSWNSVFYVNTTHPSNHSHCCLLKYHGTATLFSFLTGQISLPCNVLIRSGTNCLYLFHSIQILAFTAASASLSTLKIAPK